MRAFLKKYLILLPAGLLLGYTLFRAYKLSFTIDEGFSFMFYALDSYSNIFHFKLMDPNNHVLNSFLMKFSSSVFPLSELTLRLQSIIAHIMYMLFTWLIFKDFKNGTFRLAAWLLLNLNPYLLDFFSLARGYGMSWSFMVASLYFLKQSLLNDTRQPLYVIVTFGFAALGVLASFILLNYYIVLLVGYGCLFIYAVIKNRQNSGKIFWLWLTAILIVVFSSILLIYAFLVSYKLSKAGMLYFGGVKNFWIDTIKSIIDSTLYGHTYGGNAAVFLKAIIILVPLASLLFLLYKFLIQKKSGPDYYFVMALTFILLMICTCLILEFRLLGIRLIIGRAAMYLWILFLLVFSFILNYSISLRFKTLAAMIIVILPLFHFINTANFSSFYEWASDASTKEMMQDMNNNKIIPKTDKKIVIQPDWLFVTSSMFYQYLYHYNWMEPIESKKEFDFSEDYYYFQENYLGELRGQPVSIIKRYPLSGTILLKNEAKAKTKLLYTQHLNFSESVKNINFTKFFKKLKINDSNCIEVDHNIISPDIKFNLDRSYVPNKLMIKCNTSIYFPGQKNGELIITLEDSSGKTLKWDNYNFDRYLFVKKGWMNIPFKIFISKETKKDDRIKIFIWNTGKDPVYVSSISASVIVFP